MSNVPRRKCEASRVSPGESRPCAKAPRRTGLLLAALLVAALTQGLYGESMGQVVSAATVVTVSEQSEPIVSNLDCFWWPVIRPDSSSPECSLGVKGSHFVDLPRYEKLWVGLVSDAPASSWTLEVSSAAAAEEDDWETLATWDVDSVAGNRIGSDDGGPGNRLFCAKSSVPATVSKKLKPIDGSDADQLVVRLNGSPSGKTGFRVVVFAMGRMTGE